MKTRHIDKNTRERPHSFLINQFQNQNGNSISGFRPQKVVTSSVKLYSDNLRIYQKIITIELMNL